MEADVDEANAYTYATLFFLGRFLAMMPLDRLPVNSRLYTKRVFTLLIFTLDQTYIVIDFI